MNTLTTPELIGLLSIIISAANYLYYIRTILKSHTKPHTFTWVVWSLLCIIGLMAQIEDNAGIGAWALGMALVGNLSILIFSLFHGEKNFTKSDKAALSMAALAFVPWVVTKDPLGSVILISLINVAGFYPTFRKSWKSPHTEPLITYLTGSLPLILSMLVMENFTLTTTLYPVAIIISNTTFVAFCLWRRRVIRYDHT